MKTEIILAKSWIQTPKEGYGNRFYEFFDVFLEGGRVYNFEFFWVRSDVGQKQCLYKIIMKWVAVRPHGLIFNMEGSIFRARSDPSVKKMPRLHF